MDKSLGIAMHSAANYDKEFSFDSKTPKFLRIIRFRIWRLMVGEDDPSFLVRGSWEDNHLVGNEFLHPDGQLVGAAVFGSIHCQFVVICIQHSGRNGNASD